MNRKVCVGSSNVDLLCCQTLSSSIYVSYFSSSFIAYHPFKGDGTSGGTDLPRPRGVVGQRNNQMTDQDRVKLQVLKGRILSITCLSL